MNTSKYCRYFKNVPSFGAFFDFFFGAFGVFGAFFDFNFLTVSELCGDDDKNGEEESSNSKIDK